MSDVPKFKTFKDLRSIPASGDKPKLEVVAPPKDVPSITSITSNASNASKPSKGSKDSITSKGTDFNKTEVSPSRDFQKVPNSVTRQAVPQGLFRGKSKQVWDYLWSVSRGAINPTRTVRKSRPEIKKGSGLGSFVTVDGSIKHLEDVGLIRKVEFNGSHDGNEFEIFTPDETASLPSNASNASITSHTQKLGMLALPESGNASKGQTPVNIDSNDSLRHILKTINTDDEAFADFIVNFSKISHELTGRGFSKADRAAWEKLSELLILELRAAAARAKNPVSSIPAFLTEILRRQFFAVPKSQPSRAKIKPDTIGRSGAESYEIKPLNEPGREAALEQLSEFAGDDFLEEFKKWYTADDWKWLTAKLNNSGESK